jgi:hypothetical protein
MYWSLSIPAGPFLNFRVALFAAFSVNQGPICRLDLHNFKEHHHTAACHEGYGAVASILPFLKPGDGSFDDYATRVMGEAFDDARKKLNSTGQPPIVFDTIAARIIAAAGKGERDPIRLRDVGLAGLAHDRE